LYFGISVAASYVYFSPGGRGLVSKDEMAKFEEEMKREIAAAEVQTRPFRLEIEKMMKDVGEAKDSGPSEDAVDPLGETKANA
jgi:hypothetical protein